MSAWQRKALLSAANPAHTVNAITASFGIVYEKKFILCGVGKPENLSPKQACLGVVQKERSLKLGRKLEACTKRTIETRTKFEYFCCFSAASIFLGP